MLAGLFPFTMALLFACCPIAGRGQQKRAVTEKDYGLWSTLYNQGLSPTGMWVSYRKDYGHGQDTLFARHTGSAKTYAFAGASQGAFTGDEFFNCLLPGNRLEITNLATGLRQVFPGVGQYHHLAGGKYILLAGTAPYLEVRTAAGLLIKHIEGVTAQQVCPGADKVFYSTCDRGRCSANIYFPGREQTLTLLSNEENEMFTSPAWNQAGNAVAFFTQVPGGNIKGAYLFDLEKRKPNRLDPAVMQNFPQTMQIAPGYNPMAVSGDGKRVFFRVLEADRGVPKPDSVQVWNGNDRLIYPQRQQAGLMAGAGKLGMWDVDKQSFLLLTSDSLPKVMLDGSQRYAVTMNPAGTGGLQFKYDFDTDFYLTDLETGKTSLWLTGHSTAAMHTVASPGGKYLAYRRANRWYVYDLVKKTHTALAAPLGCAANESGGENEGYHIIGWSAKDSSVFIGDGADIWEADPRGGQARRLTDSGSTGTAYRGVMGENDIYVKPNFDGWTGLVIDPAAGFYIYGRSDDYQRSGYFNWSRRQGLKTVVYGDGLADQARLNKDGNSMVYRIQQYESPPALFAAGGKTGPRPLVRSNTQHRRFLWGHQQLVHYTDGKGRALSGILYYPAGYVPGIQYPMVVSIYEKQSMYYHRYINPGLDDGRGFNVTEYTLNGYLVLLPDIVYEPGDPGGSALRCVSAAVSEVVARGCVRTERIGLIGHSFGGYETNFIIGQTGLFAAAVSGAGISDLPAAYLTVGNTARPNMWRFEYQQLRMGKSMFDDPQAYRRNSPMEYTANISTPLLIWAGEQDKTVPAQQSLSLYLALRRLGKKQIMLVYPGERHALEDTGHKQDLTRRVKDWFGHFLKGEKAEWISEGVE